MDMQVVKGRRLDVGAELIRFSAHYRRFDVVVIDVVDSDPIEDRLLRLGEEKQLVQPIHEERISIVRFEANGLGVGFAQHLPLHVPCEHPSGFAEDSSQIGRLDSDAELSYVLFMRVPCIGQVAFLRTSEWDGSTVQSNADRLPDVSPLPFSKNDQGGRFRFHFIPLHSTDGVRCGQSAGQRVGRLTARRGRSMSVERIRFRKQS